MKFELTQYGDLKDVEMEITKCNNKEHVQQVVYSVHHSCLTQICFNCLKIRTNMGLNDLELSQEIENHDANHELNE